MEKLRLLGDQLIDSVKSAFPDHTEFDSRLDFDSDNYICNIYWKLNNDVNCPTKRSEKISIQITREALEDYRDNPNKQHIAKERFKKFINEEFDKEEERLITSSTLNG